MTRKSGVGLAQWPALRMVDVELMRKPVQPAQLVVALRTRRQTRTSLLSVRLSEGPHWDARPVVEEAVPTNILRIENAPVEPGASSTAMSRDPPLNHAEWFFQTLS